MKRSQQAPGELFKIYLGGKVRLLENNSCSSFEAVKFCGYRNVAHGPCFTVSCVCGDYSGVGPCPPGNPQCEYGGDEAVMRQCLKVGDDIPEQATIRLELEFFPSDYEPEVLQDEDDDFTSDLKRGLAALRKNPETADIMLICNWKLFKAHKAVLSARSDVFAALFSHKGTKEDESREVHFDDCDHEAMEMFLAYIYENAAPPQDVTFEVAKQLMNVANRYNVLALKKKCGIIILAH